MGDLLRGILKGAVGPPGHDSRFLLDVHSRELPGEDTMRRYPPSEEVDLVIVGAGAGGSVLAQVYNRAGGLPADVDDADLLKRFFAAIQAANARGLLLAYHDRADGGAIVAAIEMAFAARCGLDLELTGWAENTLSALFAEELGAIVQIRAGQREDFTALLVEHGLAGFAHCSDNPRNRKRVKH